MFSINGRLHDPCELRRRSLYVLALRFRTLKILDYRQKGAKAGLARADSKGSKQAWCMKGKIFTPFHEVLQQLK